MDTSLGVTRCSADSVVQLCCTVLHGVTFPAEIGGKDIVVCHRTGDRCLSIMCTLFSKTESTHLWPNGRKKNGVNFTLTKAIIWEWLEKLENEQTKTSQLRSDKNEATNCSLDKTIRPEMPKDSPGLVCSLHSGGVTWDHWCIWDEPLLSSAVSQCTEPKYRPRCAADLGGNSPADDRASWKRCPQCSACWFVCELAPPCSS